jgi:hypothetical protein
MLDAYIIDRLKKERERKDDTWQPIPLPLENPNLGDQEPARKENEKKAEVTIRF